LKGKGSQAEYEGKNDRIRIAQAAKRLIRKKKKGRRKIESGEAGKLIYLPKMPPDARKGPFNSQNEADDGGESDLRAVGGRGKEGNFKKEKKGRGVALKYKVNT